VVLSVSPLTSSSAALSAGFLQAEHLAKLRDCDVHIHLPEGAVGKDGPSGGVALVAALTSLLSGRMVRSDTAATGEVTLTGRVLPVGGIRAKVLAALRGGIHRVVIPRANIARDIGELPAHIKEKMEFIGVDTVEEALEHLLVGDRMPVMAVAKL
jgi:ATP-dependent Lon protease